MDVYVDGWMDGWMGEGREGGREVGGGRSGLIPFRAAFDEPPQFLDAIWK